MPVALINPGSRVERGTLSQALRNARGWHETLTEAGISGVSLDPEPVRFEDGRWTFAFRHDVTGVECHLTIDGLTAEQKRRLLFWPKVYWKGSSCSEPELADWLADGFRIAIVPEDA